MSRTVVAELWGGASVVRALSNADPDPTPHELGVIADSLTAENDGVRPVVRVLDQATLPGRVRGTAGGVTP